MDSVYQKWGFEIDRTGSCKQYDLKLHKDNGIIKVEEKFNFVPNGTKYDQMIVEIIQDLPSGGLGWFHYCKAGWLMWAYCPISHTEPPVYFYIISWPVLRQTTIDKLKLHKWINLNVVKSGYGLTINVPIRFDEIQEGSCVMYDWHSFRDHSNGQ